MKDKKSKYETFSEFLHSSGFDEVDSPCFHSSQKSIDSCIDSINEIVNQAKQLKKRAWMRKSREKRLQFADKFEEALSKLKKKYSSRSEILDAVKGGLLGSSAQQGFQHQFRNKNIDELSDEDLKSILDDQTIIEILEDDGDEG